MNLATQELFELISITDKRLREDSFLATNMLRGISANPNARAPWIDPPEGFLSFDPESSAVVGAVGVTVTVLSFRVAEGRDGVIKRLSINIEAGGFVQGSGDLVWTLRIDGKPVRNYERITSEKGTTQQPRTIDGIRIYSNQLVEIICLHAANAAFTGQNTVASIGGYDYPNTTYM